MTGRKIKGGSKIFGVDNSKSRVVILEKETNVEGGDLEERIKI